MNRRFAPVLAPVILVEYPDGAERRLELLREPQRDARRRPVDRAADGEEIVIAKAGKPRARLVPVPTAHKPRRPGGGKGKVWVADDFDAPLPPDLPAAFTGR